jgi:hypothetical protein
VKLGLTDDSFRIENSEKMTYNELVRSFLPSGLFSLETDEMVAEFCGLPIEGEAMTMVRWTGIFDDIKIGLKEATPAAILQHLLEGKWVLKPDDKDMVVMKHIFEYESGGRKYLLESSMALKGDTSSSTAMARTVGLPMAIATVLLLEGNIILKGGVYIPVKREIYEPVLLELKKEGIHFTESCNVIN